MGAADFNNHFIYQAINYTLQQPLYLIFFTGETQMPFYNKLTLVGHLGNTPAAKATNSGSTYTSFQLAVSEYRKKQDNTFDEITTWFDCVCWDKFIAEKITRAGIEKGALVMVGGPVSARAYAGKDGSPRCSMSVNVKEFLSFEKRAQNAQNSNGHASANAYANSSPSAPQQASAAGLNSGFTENNQEDDLPF